MALILVIGVPAAGKSTLIQRILNNSPQDIVQSTSFDDFRANLSNTPTSAREARKQFQLHVESLLYQNSHSIWLIEDIFYLQSMRRPFQKMSRKRGIAFGIVYLKVDLEESLIRNSRREKREKDETVQKVFDRIEDPKSEDVTNVLVLEDTSEDIKNVTDLLKCLKMKIPTEDVKPKTMFPELPKKRKEDFIPSELQNFDVLTRRLVSEVLRDNPEFCGRKLSRARKMLLGRKKNIPEENGNLKQNLVDLYNNL